MPIVCYSTELEIRTQINLHHKLCLVTVELSDSSCIPLPFQSHVAAADVTRVAALHHMCKILQSDVPVDVDSLS